MDPQFNQIQYDQKHFIQISKSKYFLLQDSRKKKVNRQRAALGFPPSHEVLQELSGVPTLQTTLGSGQKNQKPRTVDVKTTYAYHL